MRLWAGLAARYGISERQPCCETSGACPVVQLKAACRRLNLLLRQKQQVQTRALRASCSILHMLSTSASLGGPRSKVCRHEPCILTSYTDRAAMCLTAVRTICHATALRIQHIRQRCIVVQLVSCDMHTSRMT